MKAETQERHVSEEELSAALLEGAGEAILPHLASCPACREEAERLRRALAGFAEASRAEAERPESDWAQQRAVINERIGRHASGTRRLVWATAAAALALAANLALQHGPRVEPTAQIDPDHLLLYEVQRAVGRTLPEAFEPARLLTQEMARAAEAQTNSDNSKQGEKK